MQVRKLSRLFGPPHSQRSQSHGFFPYFSLILLLFSLAVPTSLFAAGTVLLGSQTIANTPDSNSPGEAEAFQFPATSSGTLNSLTIYVDSSSSATQLIVGIYSSSGKSPGTLLTQASLAPPASGAWNTVAVPPVSITSGKVYWIAILGTGGTLKYRDSGSNCISQTSSQSNLTSLASTWSAGSRWYSCTLSAYGSASTSVPVLSLSQSALTFNATEGSGTSPTTSSVNLTNSSSGTLTFTATSDSSWLSVTPASGTAPQSLQISAALGALAAGTYTGHISVASTGAQNSPASITVTFNVAAPTSTPSLSVSPTALSFSQTHGALQTLAAVAITVTNIGGGTLNFTASSDSTWLSVSPTSGTAPQSLQVSTAMGSLLPGTYTGHIIVSAAGVQGSPAVIPVTFIVSPVDVAPVISTVTTSSITSSTAVISWTTDKPGTSQVNFGTTTAYGTSSPLDNTLVTTHSVTLSGLLPSTLYHYQVQSADVAGSLGGSADATLTTNASVGSSCPCSIFSGTAIPATITVGDNHAVELGVKFTSDVSGFVTGIRFYKGGSNTGTHTGTLWTTSGTPLAIATFSGETSSGWQSVSFAAPVPVAPGTPYVASYHTNAGYYSADNQYFASSSVNNPPLHAPATGSSGNGVYVYGSGGSFPSSSWQASNYWVDVIFNTTQAVPTTFSISGTITGGNGATVTLSGAASATTTADGSGGFSFTGLANGNYTVTPSKSGYTISPANAAVTINNANAAVSTFAATAVTYSISGTITGGSGASVTGATLTLSGSASAVTTADASGDFSFTSLNNGSYTVAPTSTTATISPASQSVTVNGANANGVNFTATTTSNVVFFDDFLGTSLDTTKWTAMNRHGDYSNNELQCYLPANVSVSNGYLNILSQVQSQTCGDAANSTSQWNYTSGMVQWSNFNFTYGTVEFRAKMASGQGTWPAIWLLGANCQTTNVTGSENTGTCNWPNPGSDEIDITEIQNSNLTTVWQNVISGGSGFQTCKPTTADVSQNWHVYQLVWASGSLIWKIDGTQTCRFTSNLPSNPMFLMINTAMGGAGGGVSDTTLPQTMQVDYVKVTQP